MNLVDCPVCSKKVSDQAVTCCHCGHPLETGAHNNSENTSAWQTISKAKTPINVFAIAMMISASILGIRGSFLEKDNLQALAGFTYSLHIFLAVCGMFFMVLLFCRQAMYHPDALARAKQSGISNFGEDRPMVAAIFIVLMVVAYGLFQVIDSGSLINLLHSEPAE